MAGDWLDRHTARAPEALRDRVRTHLAAAGPVTDSSDPASLAGAAHHALRRVLGHAGDRSVALDLLAADALITLALLAQAQTAPERLGEFAASVLRDVAGTA